MPKGQPASPGSWKPGQSGNPGGRSRALPKLIKEQFKDDIPRIIAVFRDLALGKVPEGYDAAEIKTSDRIKAGAEVIDRVIGKAQQTIDATFSEGEQVDADWSTVSLEKRRQLLEILTLVAPGDVAEH